MPKRTGLWIDHREARIVTLDGDATTFRRLPSHADERVRPAGGARTATPYGLPGVVAEDRLARRHQQQLDAFYDAVIAEVGDAEQIHVFGPGEARHELLRRMERTPGLAARADNPAAADRMTDRQVVAHVRRHFGLAPLRRCRRARAG